MSTKLLVWNIQTFSNKKINFLKYPEIAPVYSFDGRQRPSQAVGFIRASYIVNNVMVLDPDIFVLVELMSSKGKMGGLVGGSGGQGIRLLLSMLRNRDPNWMLVPPLRLVDSLQIQEMDDGQKEIYKEGARAEAIAVFYRSTNLEFIGPWIWPQSDPPQPGQPDPNMSPNKVAVPPGGPTQNYPYPWAGCLPEGEDGRAGQYLFIDPATNGEILFPGLGSRRPFFTKFREKATGRIISLASVHYPPYEPSAAGALQRTAGYFDYVYPMTANEVVLIAGDWNVDSLSPTFTSFENLRLGQGWVKFFNSGRAQPTLYKRRQDATPTDYRSAYCLDNIAFKYGSAQARPNDIRLDILERVNTTPPPTAMYNTVAQIQTLPTANQQNEVFRLPQNFGGLGPNPGTSDHLALWLRF